MRVFSFALDYAGADAEIHPVATTFREHSSLYAHSLAVNVTAEHCWRVDRLTGPTEALGAAETAIADAGHAADCLGSVDREAADESAAGTDRGTDDRFEVLHRDPSTRILFRGWTATSDCRSIPHLALAHLGPGVLFATERHGPRYEWHVLMPTDANLGALSDAIQSEVVTEVEFDLQQVTDESAWLSAYSGRPALPYTHFEAMAAAIEHGYYETPRETTVEELAEELDLPRSTLSYRLRRAESALARSFVGPE